MKVSDLVKDIVTKDLAVITSHNVEFQDENGLVQNWDFEIITSCGTIYFVDKDELELIDAR